MTDSLKGRGKKLEMNSRNE